MSHLSAKLDDVDGLGQKVDGSELIERDCHFYGWLIQQWLMPRDEFQTHFQVNESIPGELWMKLVGTSDEETFRSGVRWMNNREYLSQDPEVNPVRQNCSSTGRYRLSDAGLHDADEVFGGRAYGYGISEPDMHRGADDVYGLGLTGLNLILAINGLPPVTLGPDPVSPDVSIAGTIASVLSRIFERPQEQITKRNVALVKEPSYIHMKEDVEISGDVDGVVLSGPNNWELFVGVIRHVGTISKGDLSSAAGLMSFCYPRLNQRPWLLIYPSCVPEAEALMNNNPTQLGMRDQSIVRFLNLLPPYVRQYGGEKIAHLLTDLFQRVRERTADIQPMVLIKELEAMLVEERQPPDSPREERQVRQK